MTKNKILNDFCQRKFGKDFDACSEDEQTWGEVWYEDLLMDARDIEAEQNQEGDF